MEELQRKIASRKFTDRHGPFAYYCVTAVCILAIFAPAASVAVAVGSIATIFLARAADRAVRGAVGGQETGASK